MANFQSSLSKLLSNKGIPVQSALSAAKQTTAEISSLTNAASSALKSFANSANGVSSSSLSKLASTLTSTNKFFTTTVNKLTSTLTSHINEATKGLKEANNKIQSLASEAAAALAAPVAFISKPVTDVIKGIDSLTKGTGLKNFLNGLSSGALSDLSKVVNQAIRTSDDVLNAITKITNDLSAVFKFNDSTGHLDLYNYTDPANLIEEDSSTEQEFHSSLTPDTRNLLTQNFNSSNDTTATNLRYTDVDIAQLSASLPEYLRKYIKKTQPSYLSDEAQDTVSDMTKSYSSIMSTLAGSGLDDETILNKLMEVYSSTSKTDYKRYISDTSGNTLGTASTNILSSFYNAAQTICPDIKSRYVNDFNLSKDLYDLLMALSLDYGITDLIDQLKNCIASSKHAISSTQSAFDAIIKAAEAVPKSSISPLSVSNAIAISNVSNTDTTDIDTSIEYPTSTESISKTESETIDLSDINTSKLTTNAVVSPRRMMLRAPIVKKDPNDISDLITEEETDDQYFDARTTSIFQNHTRPSAAQGAILAYSNISQTIGAEMILHMRDDIIILISNMKETATNFKLLQKTLTTINLTLHDLLVDTENIGDFEIISGVNTVAMTTTGTKVVDHYLNSDIRKLIQSAMYVYS